MLWMYLVQEQYEMQQVPLGNVSNISTRSPSPALTIVPLTRSVLLQHLIHAVECVQHQNDIFLISCWKKDSKTYQYHGKLGLHIRYSAFAIKDLAD